MIVESTKVSVRWLMTECENNERDARAVTNESMPIEPVSLVTYPDLGRADWPHHIAFSHHFLTRQKDPLGVVSRATIL